MKRISALVSGILEDEGYEAREAGDSEETFAAVGSPAESYFAGHLAPGQPSRRHADPGELKQEHPAVPVVIMSGHGTIETAVQAIKLGAYDFIEKPFKADRMILVIKRAIEAARLKRENEELRVRAGSGLELIGNPS